MAERDDSETQAHERPQQSEQGKDKVAATGTEEGGREDGDAVDSEQGAKEEKGVMQEESIPARQTNGQSGTGEGHGEEAAGLKAQNGQPDEVETTSQEAGTEALVGQREEGGNEIGDAAGSGHRRTGSKVEVIEAPNRNASMGGKTSTDTDRSSVSNVSGSSSLQPDPTQHRHDSRTDRPSSYQPSPPRSYLQLRAIALQLPNNFNTSTFANASHVDPPTLILEGRTNLSSARRSFYPKVTRTLPELHLWLLALTLTFPASIFSPFTYPLPSLDGGSDAAIRNYLITVTNQLSRILIKPYVLSHPATVALIDCDFNYAPTLPHIGPGSSPLAQKRIEEGLSIARAGFDPLKGKGGKGISLTSSAVTSTWDVDGVAAALGLPTAVHATNNDATSNAPTSSKNPLSLFSRANSSPRRIQHSPPVALPPGEEDEEEEDLTLARNEITRLEMQFEKASRVAHMVVDKNGALNATLQQLIQALSHLDQLDTGRLIAKRSQESEFIGATIKGIEGWSAAESGANSTILSTISPCMAYQSLNARMAIDALLRRAAAASHRHSSLVVLVQKRREAERLKRVRGEIRQEEVDWVLSELREAQRTTQTLTNHLATFTTTLKEELNNHSRFTHSDIQGALISHARNSMRAHKFMLNSLTKARDDLLARKEGKEVKEVAAESVREGPMPVEAEVQEEEVAVVEQPRDEEGGRGGGIVPEESQSRGQEWGRRSFGDDEHGLPTASSTSTLSRDKALPVAPTDEGSPVARVNEVKEVPESSFAIPTQGETDDMASPTVSPPLPAPVDSPWTERASVTQSGFLPPSQPPQQEAQMAQSAFLPSRNMDRYTNPFARLDPSLPPSSSPSTVRSPSKPNDVWANRSRLSASDAARSLAGRF